MRDPASATVETDRYGGPISPATYSRQWEVWASRRDVSAHEQPEEAVLVEVARVRFTVRHRAEIAALGDIEVVDGGAIYRSTGPALERGMRGAGASHLEIHAEHRA